ncbi:MAG: acetate--CoA ligase [Gaiellaceae bacterium]
MQEQRKFEPPAEFSRHAHIKSLAEYDQLYNESVDDPDKFWSRIASELHWFKQWDKVLEWNCPWAKWFVGGQINLSYNCLDRHVAGPRKNKAAIIWESEPGEVRTLTYQQLHREVQKFANVLKSLGVKKGDRVAIYMGMTPELPVAMLACARIGAPHTIVFGGFSSHALIDRIHDSQASAVITQDGSYRRGSEVKLFPAVEEALKSCPTVKHVVVYKRTGTPINMQSGRDHWWHELMANASDVCPAEPLDAEHPLYILYTSGTTGKPKGIVHTTGGYLTGVTATTKYVFDLKDDDVYWCTADVGWITGHSYIVYGPLCNRATSVLYEGTPDYPDKDRWWAIAEKYKVTILYTAPTAIRSHMKWGPEHAAKHDLSRLRLLGSVGEPINPEAWVWYHEHIGGGRCPIVDTWWQTETGMIMITPLSGITTTKPGSATKPFPGVDAGVFNEAGEEVGPGGGGYLVLRRPWPAMLRGLYKEDERYRETYWSKYPDTYFAGDGARIDEDGDFWLLGRVDDVMNVSGHRISTIEVESALVDHKEVAEAAVAARNDATTGQAIVAFVTLKGGSEGSVAKLEELRDHVAKKIGPIAKPANIVFTPELPKTRSGKIMRRLLRDVAENRPLGDTTTLADPAVVDELRSRGADEQSRED